MNEENKTPDEIPTLDGIEYYWCVNCGHHGKYTFRRLVTHVCDECRYDSVTPFELEEIMQDEHLKFKFRNVLK